MHFAILLAVAAMGSNRLPNWPVGAKCHFYQRLQEDVSTGADLNPTQQHVVAALTQATPEPDLVVPALPTELTALCLQFAFYRDEAESLRSGFWKNLKTDDLDHLHHPRDFAVIPDPYFEAILAHSLPGFTARGLWVRGA